MRAVIENPTPEQLAKREANRRWRDANRERYRELMREAGRRWREDPANRAVHNERTRRWAQSSTKPREQKLRRNFGITLEQLAQQIELQGGCCPICARALQGGRKQHVDHDHATGLVRGVLCAVCNRVLGLLRDDADAADRVCSYLRSAGVWRAK